MQWFTKAADQSTLLQGICSESFVFVGNLLNGYFISYLIFGSLTIHIPFLITLVAGDLLAGEATSGTYRLLVSRPVSRLKLVTSKFFSGIIYTNLLVLWLAILSMVAGILIFGVGELIVYRGGTIIVLAKNDILWRFFWAYGFASLAMSVVASLAFLFSSLVENAIGPIITTMAIIIIFLIISAINVDVFRTIKPYLFTNYMLSWRLFFDKPVEYGVIIKSALILFGHIVVLYGAAVWIFMKKDILS